MNGPYSPDSTVLAGYVFNCFLTYDIAICRAEQKVIREEQIQVRSLSLPISLPLVLPQTVDRILNIPIHLFFTTLLTYSHSPFLYL